MAKVFVTGGSGFVGRNLIPALLQEGYEVVALARSDKSAEAVKAAGANQVVMGDLDSVAAMQAGMQGCEVVVHAAAEVSDWGDYAQAYRSTVTGTENVLQAAKAAGVAKFIHVSTESVLIGIGARPIVQADETWPRAAKPLGNYPKTKGLAEERVQAANSPQFATVIVRPRMIWGAGDTTLLPQFVKAVQSGGWRWIGGGQHLTSTTHIADVCEGILLAIKKARGGEIYFLTDGQPVVFKTFVTELLATQGVTPGNGTLPLWLAKTLAWTSEKVWLTFRLKGAPPITRTAVRLIGTEMTLNDAKARRELGYVGHMTQAEGLVAMQHEPIKA